MIKYLIASLSLVVVSALASSQPLTLILDQTFLLSKSFNDNIIVKYVSGNKLDNKIEYLSGTTVSDYTIITPSLKNILTSENGQSHYPIANISDKENGELGFLIINNSKKHSYILNITNGKLETTNFKLNDLNCNSDQNNNVFCQT